MPTTDELINLSVPELSKTIGPLTKKELAEETPEQLAIGHWQWIDGLIQAMKNGLLLNPIVYGVIKYIYITAFIHGYKHGKETKKENQKAEKS